MRKRHEVGFSLQSRVRSRPYIQIVKTRPARCWPNPRTEPSAPAGMLPARSSAPPPERRPPSSESPDGPEGPGRDAEGWPH
jgi:hypothetical protein